MNRLPGKVTLTQPISLYISCTLLFLLFVIVLVFTLKAEVSRKETVKGYLLPAQGLVKVYADRTGILEQLSVSDGSYVEAGQILATIRNSQNLTTGLELSTALKNELSIQMESLVSELNVSKILFDKQLTSIDRKLTDLAHSSTAIVNALDTSKKRLEIKNAQYRSNLKLHKQGYISTNALEIIQDEVLEAQESVDRLRREVASISVEISSLELEKLELPEKRALKTTEINRQISVIQTEIIQLDNQYRFTKSAPESGFVTAIQPTVGSQVDANSPILSIIPKDSPLVLELLLPSRSAGFIQNGDQVMIRFDAFPYQKFGLVEGEVINIDKALILPGEKRLPINVTEAMYRVRASIKQQYINAYGKSFSLKIGMIAEADIVLDKRNLVEWLLDPIYAIKGKI